MSERSLEELAALFGDVDVAVLSDAVSALEAATGKSNVVEELVADINQGSHRLFTNLDIDFTLSREELRVAIDGHLSEEDQALRDLLLIEDANLEGSLSTMRNVAIEMAGPSPVWALKWDRARTILEEHPPPSVMRHFGASTIEELLEQQDIKQIFAGLRFAESTDWMHKTFDAAYRTITPDDFEERELEVIVLDPEWEEIAKEFVEKKHHNLSHLKELAVVFIIPVKLEGRGVLLRVMALLIHYLHEVVFYSKMFRHIAQSPDTFSDRFVSLLRGDVPEAKKGGNADEWLIIQRYLVKEDPNDVRLQMPHINPEALHYRRAAEAYVRLGERFDELRIEHWNIGSHVALLRRDGPQSLDLIDNIMSLADGDKGVEYNYHQHEALWNELFARFMGQEVLEDMMIQHLFDGVITIEGWG